MTPVDPMDLDYLIRDALRTTRPAHTVQFADIEADAMGRMRRGRTQLLSAAVAVAAAVALVVGLAIPGARSDTGRVMTKPAPSVPSGHHVAASSSSSTTTPATTAVTAPVTTSPHGIVHRPAPVVTPITTAPAPPRRTPPTTAAAEPSPPATTTSTTVAPAPEPYVVTLILDADGLHAPASVTTSGVVQIRFLDQRPKPRSLHRILVKAPGYPDAWILLPWTGSYGGFGQIVEYPNLSGAVSFLAFDANTNEQVSSEYATTDFLVG